GDEEMSQVRAGEPPACGAVTVGIDREVAPPVLGALDVHAPVGCEHGAVAAHPRRSHAIEEVDAAGDTLHQIFGRADAHQVTWLARGQLEIDALEDSVHVRFRFAYG